MSIKAQIIFTWTIPHLDDYGLIDSDSEVLKSLVFPMNKKISIKDIESFKGEAAAQGLIILYEDCIHYPKFYNYQSISDGKKAKTKFEKIPLTNIPQESPRIPEKPQPKISKENLREVRLDLANEKPFADKLPEKSNLNPLIEKFKDVNPTYKRIYANKTQRAALERLVKEFGLEGVASMIESLSSIISLPYAPKVTTPLELERDLGKIKAFVQQQESLKSSKINKIIFT